jgi:hypothetical protein
LQKGQSQRKADLVIPAVGKTGSVSLESPAIVPDAFSKLGQLQPKVLVRRMGDEAFLKDLVGLAEFSLSEKVPEILFEGRGAKLEKKTLNHQDTKAPRKDRKEIKLLEHGSSKKEKPPSRTDRRFLLVKKIFAQNFVLGVLVPWW